MNIEPQTSSLAGKEMYIEEAKDVLRKEASAIMGVLEHLDNNFNTAIENILGCRGKVIISGMGKSGLIGKKIAATLASTGTPSFFMHPAEAYHGDLGMISENDVVILISNSGESEEIVRLLPFVKSNNIYSISMTGNPNSTLATQTRVHLDISVSEEACPLQLAPTSSTTATLALGDAIAVCLMNARNFKPMNFAKFHPGGSLGRKLYSLASSEMQTENLPFVAPSDSLKETIKTISKHGLGLAIVIDNKRNLQGILTDGDIRRASERYEERLFEMKTSELMSTSPITVAPETTMGNIHELMDEHKISAILVTTNSTVNGIVKK